MSNQPRVQGRLRIHPRGFGFLELPASEAWAPGTSAFVPPGQLDGLLQNDVAEGRLTTEADGRYSARDLTLVSRDRHEIFGTLERKERAIWLRPDPQLGASDWRVVDGAKGLRRGTAVVAEIDGDAVRVLRAVPAAETPLAALMVRWDIPQEFPPAVRRASRQVRQARLERRDLRDLPTVTIDAPSTRDIDDAVSALPAQSDGAVRVLVSIADVSAFAPVGSDLDLEARRRGTSVYLPDRVVPMFPNKLSEGKMSLLERQDRPAMTVELRIDPEGGVTAVDIYASQLRSAARLSYEAVTAFLDEGQDDAVPRGVHSTLRWLRTAAARLSTARAARGGVRVFSQEAKIELDKHGAPHAVGLHSDTSAHQLIERLMVAANEAVAQWLVDRGLPGLFRVHPEPAADSVSRLSDFANNFGFEPGFGAQLTPQGLAAFQRQFESSAAAPAIRTVLRKLLGPARYTPQGGLHFGLGAPLYLHFTSPIRRYADLAVHRFVKGFLAGDRTADPDDPALHELAEHLNQRAYQARRAETERLRGLAARVFVDRKGDRFAGSIVDVKPFGLVVQLRGMGITGGVNAELLPGRFRLDAGQQAFVATRGKRRFGVGQSVTVEVVDADEALGRIELKLV